MLNSVYAHAFIGSFQKLHIHDIYNICTASKDNVVTFINIYVFNIRTNILRLVQRMYVNIRKYPLRVYPKR